MAFLHPPKLNVSNNSNILNDRQLHKDFITTFAINVSHLTGYLPLKNIFLREKFFPWEKQFLNRIFELSTGIKKTHIGTYIPIGFESNSHSILKSDRKSEFPVGKLPV